MKILKGGDEIEAVVSKSEEIDNDKIWMTGNEYLDAEIARLCSKRSEFNPSVAKSENLEDYSRHSNQLEIDRVSRK